MTHPLDSFFANAPAPVLVIAADNPVVATLPTDFEGSLLALSQVDPATPVKRGWKSVLLVASDRATLRQAASALPRVGMCRTIGVWLPEGTAPLVLHPRGQWPPLASLNARPLSAGFLTVARFDGAVGAHSVLAEFARQAVPGADTTHGGVVIAYAGRPAAPGIDVRAPLLSSVEEAGDAERDVPPDVVLSLVEEGRDAASLVEEGAGAASLVEEGAGAASLVEEGAGAASLVEEGALAPVSKPREPGFETVAAQPPQPTAHHVIDRAPTIVTDPGLDPVDELVFNPVGWRKDWDRPVIDLLKLAPGPAGVTEAVVENARAHQGVRVDLGRDTPADVLRLALAGVPLLVSGDGVVAPELAELLESTPDLDDALAREEYSLRVRRATFDHHSTLAWRSGLAARAGVRHAGLPAVSVLLATMRPQQLDFALGQVAAQRDADVELVLATHGFAADEEQVKAALGETPYVLLEFEEDVFFGDVLTGAARAASGEVLLKIDDDDWYSPHAVHDLLMARRFTGADVVGMPSEFVYLKQDDVTVRRNHPSETYNRFVAGGTILIDRGLLRALGDFRTVRRFVDTQLLAGVEAAGGRIYRTHGLGYVLNRTGSGHTWAMDDDQFRRAEITETQWPGFHPSSEMRAD